MSYHKNKRAQSEKLRDVREFIGVEADLVHLGLQVVADVGRGLQVDATRLTLNTRPHGLNPSSEVLQGLHVFLDTFTLAEVNDRFIEVDPPDQVVHIFRGVRRESGVPDWVQELAWWDSAPLVRLKGRHRHLALPLSRQEDQEKLPNIFLHLSDTGPRHSTSLTLNRHQVVHPKPQTVDILNIIEVNLSVKDKLDVVLGVVGLEGLWVVAETTNCPCQLGCSFICPQFNSRGEYEATQGRQPMDVGHECGVAESEPLPTHILTHRSGDY